MTVLLLGVTYWNTFVPLQERERLASYAAALELQIQSDTLRLSAVSALYEIAQEDETAIGTFQLRRPSEELREIVDFYIRTWPSPTRYISAISEKVDNLVGRDISHYGAEKFTERLSRLSETQCEPLDFEKLLEEMEALKSARFAGAETKWLKRFGGPISPEYLELEVATQRRSELIQTAMQMEGRIETHRRHCADKLREAVLRVLEPNRVPPLR